MVTLRWGDIISILLPGVVALFGLREFVPLLKQMSVSLNNLTLSSGVLLLICAGIAGGVIDALRRVLLEKWLIRVYTRLRKRNSALASEGIVCCHNDVLCRENPADRNVFYHLSPQNLPLFESGVENSWRYYVFYCNLGFAVLFALFVRMVAKQTEWLHFFFSALRLAWLTMLDAALLIAAVI